MADPDLPPQAKLRGGHIARTVDHVVSMALMAMMGIVVLLSTAELAVLLVRDVLNTPVPFIAAAELLELFGLFLNILIGLELIETVRLHLAEGAVRVEMVIMVAMIAVLRKIILLDPKETPGIVVLGVALLVLGLGVTFYLVRRAKEEAR
jgi:uncharacterized membrane protein (DUF373 family)